MLRSGYLSWMFSPEAAAGMSADVSPWVHAFEWGRRREQWTTDPAGPSLLPIDILVDESSRFLSEAVEVTFGALTPQQRRLVASEMSAQLDDEFESVEFAMTMRAP